MSLKLCITDIPDLYKVEIKDHSRPVLLLRFDSMGHCLQRLW